MKALFLLPLASLLTVPPLLGESLDRKLYDTIHDDWQSPLMDHVMSGASQAGDREICLTLCVGLLAFGDEKARQVGKLSSLSLLGGQAVSAALKLAVNRERPEGGSDRRNSSFPSGHAAGAFSVAYVVGSEYPSLKLPSYLLAGLVAISRVYLGRHYPSDVLAGAVIGCSAGYLTMKYKQAVLSFHL